MLLTKSSQHSKPVPIRRPPNSHLRVRHLEHEERRRTTGVRGQSEPLLGHLFHSFPCLVNLRPLVEVHHHWPAPMHHRRESDTV